MVGIYEKMNANQVTSLYTLIKFLRRLRVIGTFHAQTVQAVHETQVLGIYDVIDMTDAIYGVKKLGYDPRKGLIDVEEKLEQIFGRIQLPLRGTP